jgi:hypothetical protein
MAKRLKCCSVGTEMIFRFEQFGVKWRIVTALRAIIAAVEGF